MKRVVRYSLLCCVLLALLAACDIAPKRFPTSSGDMLALDAHAGKWIFINYWAPWCSPCREEIPVLNKLAKDNPERVLVLGVHVDRVLGQKLKHDVRDMGIEFTVLATDPGPALGLSPSPVVPVTWVLDTHGAPYRLLAGPQTSAQLYAAMEPN